MLTDKNLAYSPDRELQILSQVPGKARNSKFRINRRKRGYSDIVRREYRQLIAEMGFLGPAGSPTGFAPLQICAFGFFVKSDN